MDEEQQQNYRNLFINMLLTCVSGEEAEILNANRELIEAEFVEAIDHFIDKGSRLIQDFPKDSKLINQEMTIEWYKIAATIFIRYALRNRLN